MQEATPHEPKDSFYNFQMRAFPFVVSDQLLVESYRDVSAPSTDKNRSRTRRIKHWPRGCLEFETLEAGFPSQKNDFLIPSRKAND